MHQSSFRILRWTEDDRPYTKDFQDLFCTLVVALPLGTHRVRLTKRYNTFTTGEAIGSLSNLRFTQSNRRPSPNDPNVMVTTKIATTFSMVPSMAKYLCNRFLEARLVESVENKTSFSDAGSTWQLTPKGISLLQAFAHRNGVQERHILTILDSPRNNMNLMVLERDQETDKLNSDRATAEVIFRRFAGIEGPNLSAPNQYSSDSDSVNDFPNGILGIKIVQERKIGNKVYHKTFTGKAAVDWLMNCCTLADEREAHDLGKLFMEHKFVELLYDDKSWHQLENARFPCTKTCLFRITEEGQHAAKWSTRRPGNGGEDSPRLQGASRDSNNNRMKYIVNTPSLRLLFREFLKDTHCEENLVFYTEVKEFLDRWKMVSKKYEISDIEPPLETSREILAAAYDLYNAFLAPGSPCELNIDHNLRNALVGRMTKFELPDTDLHACVQEIIRLYDEAQASVFKLMASDSVPKFRADPKYAQALHEHAENTTPTGPASSRSSGDHAVPAAVPTAL